MQSTVAAANGPEDEKPDVVPFLNLTRSPSFPFEPFHRDFPVLLISLDKASQWTLNQTVKAPALTQQQAFQYAMLGDTGLAKAADWSRSAYEDLPLVRQQREIIDRGEAQIEVYSAAIDEELRHSDWWRGFTSELITPFVIHVDRVFTWRNGPALCRTAAWAVLAVLILLFDIGSLSYMLASAGLLQDAQPLTAAAIVAGVPLSAFALLSFAQSRLGEDGRKLADRLIAGAGIVLTFAALSLTAVTLGSKHGEANLPGVDDAASDKYLVAMMAVNLAASVLASKACKSMAEQAFSSIATYSAKTSPQYAVIRRERRALFDAKAACVGMAAGLRSVAKSLDQARAAACVAAEAQVVRARKIIDGRRAKGEGDLLQGED